MVHNPDAIYPREWTKWQQWNIGQRVMIRYRTADDPPFSDALGYVKAVTDQNITLATRQGDITLPAERLVTGKTIPPAPARRNTRTTRPE